MNIKRIDRLRELALATGIDGVAVMPGTNMYYLSGIQAHLSERPMILFIPVDDQPAIIVPALESGKAIAADIPENRIFSWEDDEGYKTAFQKGCARLELSEFLLGVEAYRMRLLEVELLKRYAPGLETVHIDSLLADMRSIKDQDEIAFMKKAAAVAEAAVTKLIPRLKVGQTEKQVASMLIQELMSAGSEAAPFSPIVSAGPNSALPHATPTDRKLQMGDLLVVDWGAVINGYPSDITRTFIVGDSNSDQMRMFEAVKLANNAARSLAGPGVTGQEIDRAARSIIEEMDFGPHFIHRTGHGLGLEGHEPPYMVEGNRESLAEGVVFTIEPGVYVPGLGGVRIEDDILITRSGSESLTKLPRELIQVG